MNQSMINNLDALMKQKIDNGDVSGISMYVSKDSKCVYRKNFGYANKEKNQLMKDDTIFRMYSMSKPVTAVAAMILVERGKLDLFDPVEKYLPGFRNQKVATKEGLVDVNRPVMIQDLLSMTSGLSYPDLETEAGRYMNDLFEEVQKGYENDVQMPTVEFCNHMGEKPLLFQPGTAWAYGTSADVMGAVIEVVSGVTYGEFLDREIFAPLGMKDTGFYVPENKVDRFAELYEYSSELGKNVPCTWRHLALTKCFTPPKFESGGAGVISTVDDYSKFAHMLMNNGAYEHGHILSKNTLDYMMESRLSREFLAPCGWESLKGYGYGSLMRILEEPRTAGCYGGNGDFGWDGWAGTYFFVNRVDKVVMMYMVQQTGGPDCRLIRNIRNVIYSNLD